MTKPTFSPVINLGHILQAAIITVSVVGAYFTLDKRVALNDAAIGSVQTIHSLDNNQLRAGQDRIETKLDRLIEKQSKKGD